MNHLIAAFGSTFFENIKTLCACSQLLIDNTVVKQVESFKFLGLGSTISSDVSWKSDNNVFLEFLHHCVVWSRLLRGESPAGNTCEVRIQNNRATLPTIESVYHTRCVHKSKNIVRDATHPANHLFELFKSGKRYRSVKSKTTRFRNSFYLEAIRYMNGEGGLSSK